MPSPKPRAENGPCGCKVNGFNDKIGWHMEIAYCPLHASAPKLLAALEELYSFSQDLHDESADDGDGRTDYWQSQEMETLLTKVEAILQEARQEKLK